MEMVFDSLLTDRMWSFTKVCLLFQKAHKGIGYNEKIAIFDNQLTKIQGDFEIIEIKRKKFKCKVYFVSSHKVRFHGL